MVEKELVLMAFSQYGLGLQFISDSLYLESKGLLAKPRLKLPPMHPDLNQDTKNQISKVVSGLEHISEYHAHDQFLQGVALREACLGHIRTGTRFSEAIYNPLTKFRTLLSIGGRFKAHPTWGVTQVGHLGNFKGQVPGRGVAPPRACAHSLLRAACLLFHHPGSSVYFIINGIIFP